MSKLKKILPLGVLLLLSGCTTVIDEHQGCSSDPVYIYFTSQSDVHVDVDITTTRSEEADAMPIGIMGIGHTAGATPSLNSIANFSELLLGLQNDKYLMAQQGTSNSYAVTPNAGVATPTFPYIDNSAVSIYAYAPYIVSPQYITADGWYLPLDVKANGGQTDYLYASTTCSLEDYNGNIPLDFKHALIRLDVIVSYGVEMGGSTEGPTEEDGEGVEMGGSTEGSTDEDGEGVEMGGSTEGPTEEDGEGVEMGGSTEGEDQGGNAPSRTVSYAPDNEYADGDYEALAPGYRRTRAVEPLTVTLYTDNDGRATLGLKDAAIRILNVSESFSETNTVTHSVEPNLEADTDTLTFYLLPGTKLYQLKVGNTYYHPYRGENKDEENKLTAGDQLPTTAGYRREIKIQYE